MNPGPRFQCGLCKKYCKASDRHLECEECEKRFHASCSNLSDNELLRIESGDGACPCEKKLAFLQLLRSSEAAEKLRKKPAVLAPAEKPAFTLDCRKAGFYEAFMQL